MNTFSKRLYTNPIQLFQDVAYLFTKLAHLRARRNISPAFRERLMLTVTAVNACRYCAYFHARLALTTGISSDEIKHLLEGMVTAAPADEIPALVYAQHWAETNASPDAAARAALVTAYGEDTARAIEYVLRMIRVGNLLGNTFDYVLHRLSGGRLASPSAMPVRTRHFTSGAAE